MTDMIKFAVKVVLFPILLYLGLLGAAVIDVSLYDNGLSVYLLHRAGAVTGLGRGR